jgi:hypothetical protein
MRHANATTTLNPSINRDTGRTAQISGFFGGDHGRLVDTVTPILHRAIQVKRVL